MRLDTTINDLAHELWAIAQGRAPIEDVVAQMAAQLHAFAVAVQEEERERCAQVADANAVPCGEWGSELAATYRSQEAWAAAIAKSIRQRLGATLAADLRDAISFPPLPPSPAEVSDLILQTREYVQTLGWGNRERLYTESQVRAIMAECAAMAAARERKQWKRPAFLWPVAMPEEVARWFSAHPPEVVPREAAGGLD